MAEARRASSRGARRCPRSRVGRRRGAGRRPPRSPSSGGRPSRESGVPCRYTDRHAAGIAHVVEGEGAAVGQAQRARGHHERSLRTRGYPAWHSQLSTARGNRVQLFSSEKIRNVALVGHGGVGKTTLAEALLHRAGAINRLGRVEDGTTVSDHDPEEQRRGISLSLAVTPFEWKGHKVNLIDTPGLRRLPRRRAGRPAGRRPGGVRGERGRRRGGADRGRLAGGGRSSTCPA